MKILTVNSYAKINIGLKIINQRIDNYHNIETVFQEVQFHDTITIKKINEGYKLSSNNVDFPIESSNTCVQAYLRLKKEFPELKGVNIHVNKNIPMGSGLGGGSSNAASTIIGINNLYDIGLTKQQLKNISQDIGADVPFFIEGGIQHGQGIGDKLTPLKIKLPYTILLVFPNNTVNTRWAYSQIRNKLEIPIKAVNFADLMEKEMMPNLAPKIPKKSLKNNWFSIIQPRHCRPYNSYVVTGSAANSIQDGGEQVPCRVAPDISEVVQAREGRAVRRRGNRNEFV